MKYILIGNIIAFIASILMVYTGILNKKKKILLVQSIEILFFGISNLILNGITGAIINFINLIRNIVCYNNKLTTTIKLIISIISAILTLQFNNLNLIGLLPLISSLIYLWFMDIKNIKKFKLMLALTMCLWLIYDLTIKLYTAAIFDLLTIISCIYTASKNKTIDIKK